MLAVNVWTINKVVFTCRIILPQIYSIRVDLQPFQKPIIVSSQRQLGACLAPWNGAQNVNIIWHSTPKTWLNTWTYTDINVDKWQSSNHSKCFPVFQLFWKPSSKFSISSIGLKHSHQPEETLGAISLWSWALHRGETGFQRVLVNSPGGWLRCLLVGWLGRFRYAYHLRPWEKSDVYVGISYYSNCWCWWTGFFLLMILAMNVFKAFSLWEISQSLQNKQMDLNSPTKTEPACRQLSNSLDIFKPFSNLLAWLLARCWELIAAKPFQPPESSKGFGG